jgi:hypothetical protein
MFSDKPVTSYDIDKLERQISALESKIYSLSLELKGTKREVESFSSKFKDWLWKKELNSDIYWYVFIIATWSLALILFMLPDKRQDNKPDYKQVNTSSAQEGALNK